MDLLKDRIRKAGVVGAGGAGFPSAYKLSDNIETVLINMAECEPLLFTDLYLFTQKRELIENALKTVVTLSGAKRGVIAMKRHTAQRAGVTDGAFSDQLEYKVIDDVYPAGDELVLVYEALGITVPAAGLPSAVGVVVYNLETLLNIEKALQGIPVTRKTLTVAGDTGETYLVRVPVGTSLAFILQGLGISLPEGTVVLDGGPAMGKVAPKDAAVTKTTKAYTVLPRETVAIQNKLRKLDVQLKRASSACCGCRTCTDLCPRHLLGYQIEPHRIVKMVGSNVADLQVYLGAYACCSCGLCDTVACSQGISPKSVFAKVKSELVKNGIRPKPAPAVPSPLRSYRRVPADRMTDRLGVRNFVREDYRFVDLPRPDEVKINLRQHIGAVYPVCVEIGQQVTEGTPLTKIEDTLGAPVHASIDGVIAEITPEFIRITQGGEAK